MPVGNALVALRELPGVAGAFAGRRGPRAADGGAGRWLTEVADWYAARCADARASVRADGRRAATVFLVGARRRLADTRGLPPPASRVRRQRRGGRQRVPPSRSCGSSRADGRVDERRAAPHDVTADDGAWDSARPRAGRRRSPGRSSSPASTRTTARYHGSPGVGDDRHGRGRRRAASRRPAGTSVPAARNRPRASPTRCGCRRTRRRSRRRSTRPSPAAWCSSTPGVYREQVTVTTPYITIRGEDRNRTIIDGGLRARERDPGDRGGRRRDREPHGAQPPAERLLLERGQRLPGVLRDRREQRRLRDLRLRLRYGQFDHSYASGSPDSGFYIGQCNPCDAVITDVERPTTCSGTRGRTPAGTSRSSTARGTTTRAGIVPNTLDSEPAAPQRGALIAGNHVYANGNRGAPMRSAE